MSLRLEDLLSIAVTRGQNLTPIAMGSTKSMDSNCTGEYSICERVLQWKLLRHPDIILGSQRLTRQYNQQNARLQSICDH
jgi:hypothetical protein